MRITVLAAMRNGAKVSNARVVKTTRWRADEWSVVTKKARQVRLTPSEYVRCKALNQPLAPRPRKSA